jgi:hypothetical protein
MTSNLLPPINKRKLVVAEDETSWKEERRDWKKKSDF